MLVKYFYDEKLAQASYMVGDEDSGEALVIDPSRDITPYLEAAKRESLQITHVAETHIHADFLSGSRELAHATGARLWLSDMGDADWKYTFTEPPVTPARDGDAFMVGNIEVEILHTPGHTPEHIVFQITDTASADKPMGIFTGDFLFVGAVGRPDLLETAAGIADTAEAGARQQFRNVKYFKSMPDYLQIWPGHGAGSACGKALGSVPSTTLGYEKLFNPAFQFDDENKFVAWLLEGQPETPRYFARMKIVNRDGPELLEMLSAPQRLEASELKRLLDENLLVIDARRAKDFAAGHVHGTLHVPGSDDHFSTWAGWYAAYEKPTYLIAGETELPRLVRELRAIGVDNIPGYFTPESLADQFTETTRRITIEEAADRLKVGAVMLDVRGHNEYGEQHVADVIHIPMGDVPHQLDKLPRDREIIVQCGGGIRSMVVTSLLQKHNISNVINLRGGIDAWEKAGLPLESE